MVSTLAPTSPRHHPLARGIGALVCGVVAGILLSGSLEVGFRFTIAPEDVEKWTSALWGEHWVVRPLASLLATFLAGVISGILARSRGRLISALASVPTALLWTYIAVAGWTGSAPFLGAIAEVSLGNRLCATLLALVTIPVGVAGGELGQVVGGQIGPEFDRRPHTLLGIKWYHYLWIPFVLHLVIAQSFWAVLYGLQWVIVAWRAGEGLASFIPIIFLTAIWGTLFLTWNGVSNAYLALFSSREPSGRVAATVLKNAIGLPLLAAVLQALISLLNAGLAKLLS